MCTVAFWSHAYGLTQAERCICHGCDRRCCNKDAKSTRLLGNCEVGVFLVGIRGGAHSLCGVGVLVAGSAVARMATFGNLGFIFAGLFTATKIYPAFTKDRSV